MTHFIHSTPSFSPSLFLLWIQSDSNRQFLQTNYSRLARLVAEIFIAENSRVSLVTSRIRHVSRVCVCENHGLAKFKKFERRSTNGRRGLKAGLFLLFSTSDAVQAFKTLRDNQDTSRFPTLLPRKISSIVAREHGIDRRIFHVVSMLSRRGEDTEFSRRRPRARIRSRNISGSPRNIVFTSVCQSPILCWPGSNRRDLMLHACTEYRRVIKFPSGLLFRIADHRNMFAKTLLAGI